MKTLLILRHAHAVSDSSVDDHDRPLDESGQVAAQRVGRLIYEEGLTPDAIITSSAVRAKATAVAVAEACRFEGEPTVTRRLYLSDAATHMEFLRAGVKDGSRVLLVGHYPAVGDLVQVLTNETEEMPPTTLARIMLPVGDWNDLDEDVIGRLVRLWRPSDLA